MISRTIAFLLLYRAVLLASECFVEMVVQVKEISCPRYEIGLFESKKVTQVVLHYEMLVLTKVNDRFGKNIITQADLFQDRNSGVPYRQSETGEFEAESRFGRYSVSCPDEALFIPVETKNGVTNFHHPEQISLSKSSLKYMSRGLYGNRWNPMVFYFPNTECEPSDKPIQNIVPEYDIEAGKHLVRFKFLMNIQRSE